MQILGIPAGRDVGAAYKYLLDVRLDEGPIGKELATKRLKDWWAARS
jgi:poly(A) polymerase